MATKIRLQRHGKKRSAFYHIVAADSRAKRDGRFIEKIGTYNPNTNPATIDLDFDRALHWVKVGAVPTDTVKALLSYKGVLLKNHLDNGVLKGALTEADAQKKFDAWMNEKASKISGKADSIAKAKEDANAAKLAAEKEVNDARAKELEARNAPEVEEVAEQVAEDDSDEDLPEEPTKDELDGYSKKVNKRIAKLTAQRHEEARQREELERFSRTLIEENKKLKGTVTQNQEALLEQAKKTAAGEMIIAKRQYKQAYEAGDADNGGCPWTDSDGDGVYDKDDNCPNESGSVANNGCPEVEEPTELIDFINNEDNRILFRASSSRLDKADKAIIDNLKSLLDQYPNASITIEGHASSDGSESYNQTLSEKRAAAVKSYLVEKGVAEGRLSTVGYGESRPISENNTANGRLNNRRVKINRSAQVKVN